MRCKVGFCKRLGLLFDGKQISLKMWLVILSVGFVFSILVGAFSSPDTVNMNNFFEVLRQNTLYNIIGVKYNWDDIFKKRRNKFPLPGPMPGRVAVITGGARGLGTEVVKNLLLCDFHVVIGCRRVSAGEKAVEDLRAAGVVTGTTKVLELDVGSLASVRTFAKQVLDACPRIHVLYNNAGIMLVPFELTKDGNESQFAVNYLGHFLLTHLLLPRLEASTVGGAASRIINVSSCAHYGGSMEFEDLQMKKSYVSSAAYARSKLAQVMFTKSLQKRLAARNANVQVYAVHPGVVNTDLFKDTYIRRFFPWMPGLMFKSPEEGARTLMYAGLAPELEGRGGVYLSNCGEEQPSRVARDQAKQDRLFSETCTLLGIQDFDKS
ncbi:hypothetical protein B566_EDAN001344 [Ephemera danica]|nr:hypothetical protein B566_EDAN001344 [Ephemera danica]